LDIVTFVDTTEVKFGSLKVWNWIVQSYKIKPKSHHIINPPPSNLVKLGQSSQLWTISGQSWSNGQTRGVGVMMNFFFYILYLKKIYT